MWQDHGAALKTAAAVEALLRPLHAPAALELLQCCVRAYRAGA
jgi:hypothetical protein